MTADELARLMHEATNRWMMGQRRDPFAAWDGLSPWHRDLYAAVAEAVLRELGCPAPLVVDAGKERDP